MVDERNPAFPSTHWSRILAGPRPRDWDALARAYREPVRAWLAARFRLDADGADDLVQEAFAWILESGLFDRADPARGRFRGLLKTALARFARDHLDKAVAQKRGGGGGHARLDDVGDVADSNTRAPDEALDDAWRRDLIERARARLESELDASGRHAYYLVFRDFFLTAGDALDHAAIAARHGVSRTDVANWLDYAKRRYRALLRSAVLDTTSSEEAYREELAWLFGAPR